jgi:hypothetical protein
LKKILVAAASLAVALVGFASVGIPSAHANPSKVWVVNENVAGAVITASTGTPTAFTCDMAATTGVNANASLLDAIQTASAMQVNSDTAGAGKSCIIVQTDGSTTAVTLNGRGLVCTTVCDGTAASALTPTSGSNGVFATNEITGNGTFTSGNTITAVQDGVSVDSGAVSTASQAQNVTLAAVSTTIQEGATACGTSTATPNKTAAGLTFTDINGTDLVGYSATWTPTFSTSGKAGAAVGSTVSMVQADGSTITAANLICGANAGTQTISATTATGAVAGVTGTVQRTQDITVTGVPATIDLSASPAAIACDGTSSATVTATVKDSAGNNVVNGTSVTFSVVALGTANPINTTTTDAVATSKVTPLSGNTAGTIVNVTSGSAAASLRIDCLPSLATATAAAGATATPVGGITGPNTGTGGYLGQDSNSGFPMWALAALALGSFVLVGGGIAARRAGK